MFSISDVVVKSENSQASSLKRNVRYVITRVAQDSLDDMTRYRVRPESAEKELNNWFHQEHFKTAKTAPKITDLTEREARIIDELITRMRDAAEDAELCEEFDDFLQELGELFDDPAVNDLFKSRYLNWDLMKAGEVWEISGERLMIVEEGYYGCLQKRAVNSHGSKYSRDDFSAGSIAEATKLL